MNESGLQRTINWCIGLILLSAILHPNVSQPFSGILMVFAALAALVLVYCGFKADRMLCEKERFASDGMEKIISRYEQLNELLMQRSAELSESEDEVRRLRTGIEAHAAQKDHNKCWMSDWRLHQLLNNDKFKISPLPDLQKITLAEMLRGCVTYCPGQYRELTEKEKQMTEEIKEVIRKYMY